MPIKVVRFPDDASAGTALRNELVRVLTTPTGLGPRVIMLAGGTTPLRVYAEIAEEPPERVAPGTWLLLSDDRHVPPDDERANYAGISPMAVSLGVPDTRVIHPDSELDPQTAADDFGLRIATAARAGAEFELGILGIGADGHTASLFSHDLVPLIVSDGTDPGNTLPVGTGSPVYTDATNLAHAAGVQQGIERVTVSAAVLFSFRRLIFFAPGESKQPIIAEIQERPSDYPAGRILMQHPAAEIWTDGAEPAARKKISSNGGTRV